MNEEEICFCTKCGSERLEKMPLDRPYSACNVICTDCGAFLGEEKGCL